MKKTFVFLCAFIFFGLSTAHAQEVQNVKDGFYLQEKCGSDVRVILRKPTMFNFIISGSCGDNAVCPDLVGTAKKRSDGSYIATELYRMDTDHNKHALDAKENGTLLFTMINDDTLKVSYVQLRTGKLTLNTFCGKGGSYAKEYKHQARLRS